MPSRGRNLDFDPNKSDSDDPDFDMTPSRPRKAPKVQRKQITRKRQRVRYSGGESEDISESEPEEDSFGEEDIEEEEPEINEQTGRVIRKTAARVRTYEESDTNSIDFMNDVDSAVDETRPRKKQKTKAEKGGQEKTDKKSLIVKLPVPTRRYNRARSGSVSKHRPSTADNALGTRRSSRIAHDVHEPIIALTNSGNHVDVVRPGTKSPDVAIRRALSGGKAPKKQPSAIIEAEDESFIETKNKTEEDGNENCEIAASDDLDDGDEDQDVNEETDVRQRPTTETQDATQGGSQGIDMDMDELAVVPESGDDAGADDEEDEDIIKQRRRPTRQNGSTRMEQKDNDGGTHTPGRSTRKNLRSAGSRSTRLSRKEGKRGVDEGSDFEPGVEEGAEENDLSDSENSNSSPRKASRGHESNDSSNARRSRRFAKVRATSRRRTVSDDHDSEEVAEELAVELEELSDKRPRRNVRSDIQFEGPTTRKRAPVDYRILRPETNIPLDDDGPPATSTPTRRGKGGAGGTWQRSLFSTYGPFGGAGGLPPVFGGPGGIGAAGGVESDSSDDDNMQRPRAAGVGGIAGMTPTTAAPVGFGLFPPPQAYAVDPAQAQSDQNVNFDSVGGLQGHIDQLKEMVALPLLYPEIFQRFHVTPPRGVLFHGPPGTGKTLLARALASSVSSHGRKVTFYMRKGADALSKWVGEAERQLRLLFEEARKTQPSIIFFDEIDGLAPVRSSKQEQIHASIVSTLLALMDGMDGRGQVIVIGATNRPDSVDPALRRPGRFDREFYFPLPNTEARRMILDIHTQGWVPPVRESLKDELAQLTKGYGGADLRALCTEAALNAVQRRYPQIYKSNEKLLIKPETITIAPKDFMISIRKMVPSSERSTTTGAAPLPKSVEPLLRHPFDMIKKVLAEVLPRRRSVTALEEAQYEDAEGDGEMATERMQQEFERSRVFRPRLLICGVPGMGQQYLASALLNHFEGLHVQSFDLPTLLSDSTRSPEAAIVQLFTEVKRHKPSVIYIPNVDVWYRTVGEAVISTFIGLLRSLAPTEPILLLAMLECEDESIDPKMIKDLFGFSKKAQISITRPDKPSRREYFTPIVEYINTSPAEFPDPAGRRNRQFEALPLAPPESAKPPTPPTKQELRAQKKKDRQTLNYLKVRIQPIMDQIRIKYKKFRTGVIDESQIRYLYEEEDPATIISTDLPQEQRQAALFRPYEKGTDDHGEPGLVEQASGKFYYNLEIVTIEKRLSNGYYKRPKDYLADIKKITKDAKMIGDQDRLLKANELQANVEVDIGLIELENPALAFECEAVYLRELKREKDLIEKAREIAIAEGREPEPIISNVPPVDADISTEQSTGPIVLGGILTGPGLTNGMLRHPTTPLSQNSSRTNGLSKEISDLSDLRAHRESNGTSRPSNEDVHMTNTETPSTQRGTQHSSFGPSAQTRPLHFHTGAPSSLQQRQSYPGSLSQRSAITPMVKGSHPHMYDNSASTTSSDKPAVGSSGPLNTQSTHNRREGPDLSILASVPSANSQLPDTQGSPPSSQRSVKDQDLTDLPVDVTQSQMSVPTSSQSQPSQTPPVPTFPRHPSAIHSLLNASDPALAAAATFDHPPIKVNASKTREFLEGLVVETDGCSVEQLEQVYSQIMGKIWETRGNWDRVEVLRDVTAALKDVLEDMAECQDFGPGSGNWDSSGGGRV